MNYLELVNSAVEEAGVELDLLTQVNFNAPAGSKMYTRFKKWVADAWKEIQTDNKESFFTNVAVTTQLRPRIRIYDGFSTTTFSGAQYFDAAGNIVNILADSPIHTGDATLSTYRGFLDIEELDDYSTLVPGTLFTEDTMAPNPRTFKLANFGAYAPTELDPNIISVVNKPILMYLDGAQHEISFIAWKDWMHTFSREYGLPKLYTLNPDGYLYLYPNLAEPLTVSLYGNARPQVLSSYSDLPTGLREDLHLLIVWKAVIKYANFEGDGKLWKTADREYNRYNLIMDRDAGMIARFADSVYG
jgi:hypothetical protein